MVVDSPHMARMCTPGVRFDDTPGAAWFKKKNGDGDGPQAQMLHEADSAGHGFAAACDYWAADGGRVVKMYASYETADEFVTDTLLACSTRYLYEVIREGRRCKLYVDVEWEEGPDSEQEGMDRLEYLVKELLLDLQDVFQIQPVLAVLDSSRSKTAGVVKRSYYIIAVNLAFASNTGAMKDYIAGFVEEREEHPLMRCSNGKNIVDLSVYTKNRAFRTPLSCKLGDATLTQLRGMECSIEGRGNGLVVRCAPRPDDHGVELGEVLDALVTHFRSEPACLVADEKGREPTAHGPRRNSHTKTGSCCGRGGSNQPHAASSTCASSADAPAAADSHRIGQLQTVLEERGSSGCRVLRRKQFHADSGIMIYSCRNEAGGRKCLVSEGEVHTSNNAFLKLKPICAALSVSGAVPVHAVWYGCYVLSCSKAGCVELGTIQLEGLGGEGSSSTAERDGAFDSSDDEMEDSSIDSPPTPCVDPGHDEEGLLSSTGDEPVIMMEAEEAALGAGGAGMVDAAPDDGEQGSLLGSSSSEMQASHCKRAAPDSPVSEKHGAEKRGRMDNEESRECQTGAGVVQGCG